jgi:hypothetical protein
MNTRILTLIAIALALVIAALVTAHLMLGPGGETVPNATETPSKADQALLDEGEYHRITAVSPGATPLRGEANSAAVALMRGFVEAEAATFKEESGLLTLTTEDIEMRDLGGDRKYVLDITYETHDSPATVSYVFPIFADSMGAHPNAYYRTFTFDKATGKELLISDLFADAGYLDVLSKESRGQLAPKIAEMSEIPLEEFDTEYLDSGTTPDAPNFQFFYLDGKELVIIFPPYQVGPWVIGTQEARFDRTELDVLKPEYR